MDKTNLENITQELADCMVLIEQFKLYYGITSEEITNIFWNKVARQVKRIEEGK
jgi:NTP pyrophosphatase (non-canonical NTP hydrolase)